MNTDSILPRDLATLVGGELQSGERIDWVGQPLPGRFARLSIFLVLFGIPWTTFALFWIVGASAGISRMGDMHGGSLGYVLARIFPLFGLPFVLVGLGMLSSPWWMRAKARRTAYVITDRRAILVEPGLFGGVSIRSFLPERLQDLRRTQRADGSGDLVFEREWRDNGREERYTKDIGFMAIAEVKRVEENIQALVARHAGGRG